MESFVSIVRTALWPARSFRRAAVVALALSACGGTSEADTGASPSAAADGSGPITVEHAQGTTELEGTPQKVFTFDYAALSVLDALEVPVAGVPQENLPEELASYAGDDVVNIGTLFEPDYETVAAE